MEWYFVVISIFKEVDELRIFIFIVLVSDIDFNENNPSNSKSHNNDYKRELRHLISVVDGV